jgi:hypothetical protein
MYYTTVHKTSILANNLGVHLFELFYGFLLHARQQDGRTDARRERERVEARHETTAPLTESVSEVRSQGLSFLVMRKN